MAQPVRRLPGLLLDESANYRQVIAGIVGHTVVLPGAVAWRQAMAAHFRDPYIETGAGEVGTQADALG